MSIFQKFEALLTPFYSSGRMSDMEENRRPRPILIMPRLRLVAQKKEGEGTACDTSHLSNLAYVKLSDCVWIYLKLPILIYPKESIF